MEKTTMNRQLGTKWFTFYTKVRPWIACLGLISVLADFVQYTDTYFSNWWLMLYFIASVATPVLAIIIFVKSSGDYGGFVYLVKRVLLVESICIAYQIGVQQYITNFDIGHATVVTIGGFLGVYFIWYRLNIKYFENRILKEDAGAFFCNSDSASASTQSPNFNEVPTMASNTCFCSNCGNKLAQKDLFCSRCGTRQVPEYSSPLAKYEDNLNKAITRNYGNAQFIKYFNVIHGATILDTFCLVDVGHRWDLVSVVSFDGGESLNLVRLIEDIQIPQSYSVKSAVSNYLITFSISDKHIPIQDNEERIAFSSNNKDYLLVIKATTPLN